MAIASGMAAAEAVKLQWEKVIFKENPPRIMSAC